MMITYSSKTFTQILAALLVILTFAGIVVFAEGKRGGALITFLHGAILYGLARKKAWVISAIRFWAVLLLIFGGFFLLMLFFRDQEHSMRVFISALAFGFIAVGSYYFESTPKYLIQEPEDPENPSSNQGNNMSTMIW